MKAESNCPNCKEINTYTEITNDLLLFECSFCGETWSISIPPDVPNPIRRNSIVLPKTIYVPPLFALLSTSNEKGVPYTDTIALKEWVEENYERDYVSGGTKIKVDSLLNYLDNKQ